MPVCAACGCKVSDIGSNFCNGFACERRLCIPCFSSSVGFCPPCKIRDEIDRERMRSTGSDSTIDRLYDELAETPVYVENPDYEEPEPEDDKEKTKTSKTTRRKESTEDFILRRLREIREEKDEEQEE